MSFVTDDSDNVSTAHCTRLLLLTPLWKKNYMAYIIFSKYTYI